MTHPVIMPDLGQTVAEGKIVRWLKKPGERVSKGEALLEVETDKVTMEVESYRAGYLREILVGEGEFGRAMAPIAILTDQPDEAYGGAGTESAVTATSLASSLHSMPTENNSAAALPLAPQVLVTNYPTRVSATPAAKSLARDLRVDLTRLVASRPDGLITRRDVESAIATQVQSRPALAMAAITTKSIQSIPHFYVVVDAEVSALLAWRDRWNAGHFGLRLSLNDLFVRAAALALRDVPTLNARYSNGAIEQRTNADLLLVVAVNGGLSLVPIADPTSLSWEDYAVLIRQTLNKASQGLVSPSLSEGTPALAISNMGMFGVKQFTAIIPPDSTAILAIGAVREEVIARNRQVEVGDVCTLVLGSDHRVVDGIMAAKFLERIQIHLKTL